MEISEREKSDEPLAKKLKTDDHSIGNSKEKDADSKKDGENEAGGMEECDASEDGQRSENRNVLTEADVGITEYISSHQGFNAIIKQRYSDFLVNEISADGQVIHLTDINTIPQKEEQSVQLPDSEVLSKEDLEKLQKLYENKDKEGSVKIIVGDDKERRTQVHKLIRENYSGLNSSTLDEGETKVILVDWQKGKDNRQTRNRWPSKLGDYIKFVLYKENMDTMAAINLISKYLRLKPGLFAYAGTKDKRAKTTQEITLYRVEPEKLVGLNKVLRGVGIGNIRYCKTPLKLGGLRGNRFCLVLRNVTGTNEQIDLAMRSLREAGFINYFGMQRFGTTSVATHHIGKALLLSQWKEAVELILKPRQSESEGDLAECRKIWWETRNAKEALKKISHKFGSEKQLLQGLDMYGDKDLIRALSMIPRNTRLMYVHSYQSYVWNSLVSRRIKQLGLKPIVGDLVISSQAVGDGEKQKPETVTEQNINQWTMHDVVMPQPGYDVLYPNNQVADWYKDILSEDGLNINSLKHKVKDYSLPGGYRHVVIHPQDVEWEIGSYTDVTKPLVLSDLDRIKDVTLERDSSSSSEKESGLKSLKILMSLPSSTYATMALREVFKTDTSAAHQSTLNVS